MKKGILTKTTAAVLAFSLALGVTAMSSEAAGKKPKLNRKSLALTEGETAKLKVNKNGNKITKVTWKSTDASVATVSKKGKVTAIGAGSAKVKVSFKIKGNKKKTTLKCKVTVTAAEPTPMDGAWEKAEDPTITPEIAGYVNQATEGLAGAGYEPFALLATQVVAGMKYRVFCKTTPVVLNPVSYYTIVEFYVDPQQKVSDFKVVASTQGSFEALPAASGAAVGAMVQVDSPKIDEKYLTFFKEKFTLPDGEPCLFRLDAMLGKQVVNGVIALAICERDVNVNTANPSVGYYLVTFVHTSGSDVKVKFGTAVPVTPSGSNYDVATDIPEAAVEKYADDVKTALAEGVLTNKWEKFADLIAYPIKVKADVEIKDAAAFVDYASKNKVSEDFLTPLKAEDCMNLFARDTGIMLGDGQIWINEVNKELKITALNGMFG